MAKFSTRTRLHLRDLAGDPRDEVGPTKYNEMETRDGSWRVNYGHVQAGDALWCARDVFDEDDFAKEHGEGKQGEKNEENNTNTRVLK